MKYAFIDNHKEEFPIRAYVSDTVRVSESGYYAWLKREPSGRERVDKELGEQIPRCVSEESRLCMEVHVFMPSLKSKEFTVEEKELLA